MKPKNVLLKVNSVGLFYIASMCAKYAGKAYDAKELAKRAQQLANEQLLPIIEIKSKSGDPVCFVLDVYTHFERIESNEAKV